MLGAQVPRPTAHNTNFTTEVLDVSVAHPHIYHGPDGGVEHAPDGCCDTSANPRLPLHGPPRYLLAVSDTLELDDGAAGELPGSIVRFTEIPNATELLSRLERLVAEA